MIINKIRSLKGVSSVQVWGQPYTYEINLDPQKLYSFGAIPLVLSHDAGAESRHAIGTVLIGGLCVGTFFTLFVLPVIYYMISKRILTNIKMALRK